MSEKDDHSKKDNPDYTYNSLLEQYKLLATYVQYQHIVKWTVFSIFILLNGILLQAIVGSDLSFIPKFVITLFGSGISIGWLLINDRSEKYANLRRNKAKKIWDKFFLQMIKEEFKNKFNSCSITDNDLRLFEERGLEGCSSSKTSKFVIIVLAAGWSIYLLYIISDKFL